MGFPHVPSAYPHHEKTLIKGPITELRSAIGVFSRGLLLSRIAHRCEGLGDLLAEVVVCSERALAGHQRRFIKCGRFVAAADLPQEPGEVVLTAKGVAVIGAELLTIQAKRFLHQRQHIEAGHLTPVVGKTFQLPDVPEAVRHLESGRAKGRIAITV